MTTWDFFADAASFVLASAFYEFGSIAKTDYNRIILIQYYHSGHIIDMSNDNIVKITSLLHPDNSKGDNNRIKENTGTTPNADNKINRFVTLFANRTRSLCGELSLGRESMIT